jgi:hypothetical protein
MTLQANRFRKAPAALCLMLVVTFFLSRHTGVSADKPDSTESVSVRAGSRPPERTYQNRLEPMKNPQPLLADYPEFVQPIVENRRFEAPPLIVDENADMSVRAWRFSMNARGIIEIPNRLQAARTAIVVVHPWGINDGQGWQVPQPAGFAFGTPVTNEYTSRHLKQVVNPFLKSLRGKVGLVMYSLRGAEDPIHAKLYRSIRRRPSAQQRKQGRKELKARLNSFSYDAGALPSQFSVSTKTPVKDYFRHFPGGLFRDHYNGPGYWELPIPVHSSIDVDPDDFVFYDKDGYPAIKEFFMKQGIRNVLLCGYSCTKCYRSTAAGYLNLKNDFNVFLVGDGTLDKTPMLDTIRFATSAALAEASRENLITQISWIRPDTTHPKE